MRSATRASTQTWWQAVLRQRKEGVKSFVLNAEAVAFDREAQREPAFPDPEHTCQEGGCRGGHPRCARAPFAFDLLFLNGRDLLGEQLQARRELLDASFDEEPGEFAVCHRHQQQRHRGAADLCQ